MKTAAPQIWKKFTSDQKKAWRKFYKLFLWELKEYPYTKDQVRIPREQAETIAHNLACEIAWTIKKVFSTRK